MCKIDKEMMSGITNNSNLEREREKREERMCFKLMYVVEGS
jgi:hypothetical protein